MVMMYVRFPLSLRNVEDLLFELCVDISHETVRFWWNRFGPLFAADMRHQGTVMSGRRSAIKGDIDVYDGLGCGHVFGLLVWGLSTGPDGYPLIFWPRSEHRAFLRRQ